MERSFSEALKQRRTYYSITNQSPISDQEIECIVNMTVRHVPSAFNSQSTVWYFYWENRIRNCGRL